MHTNYTHVAIKSSSYRSSIAFLSRVHALTISASADVDEEPMTRVLVHQSRQPILFARVCACLWAISNTPCAWCDQQGLQRMVIEKVCALDLELNIIFILQHHHNKGSA
jgi:hypothetical protein